MFCVGGLNLSFAFVDTVFQSYFPYDGDLLLPGGPPRPAVLRYENRDKLRYRSELLAEIIPARIFEAPARVKICAVQKSPGFTDAKIEYPFSRATA